MSPTASEKDQDKHDQPAAGAGLREADVLLPLAAAICVALAWYVVLDYERAAAEFAAVLPEVAARVGALRIMLGLLSVGGLGLAFLAARESRRRRLAEDRLRLANEALAERVARRTRMLARRTKALRESVLRRELAERQAEAAYAAGQVAAAGVYLHGVGNALSSFEAELLRLGRVLDGVGKLGVAFDGLDAALAAGDGEGAVRHGGALRQAVLDRAVPRLVERAAALGEIKEGMRGDLERYRGEFERKGRARPCLAVVRLDEELAAILDRMPRAAGYDPVVRRIRPGVTVRLRKEPFLTGLAALTRQSLEAAAAAVAVSLEARPAGGAVIVLEGVPEAEAREAPVAAFINFLNENGGVMRFESAASGHAPRLVVEVADDPGDASPKSRFP
ncbi:hypothetical protein [Solidesulfovibrio sp.]|uniref:hypothetical protein n=1 Tax=Solidesulfovibrio sp. TaxID=2910990 RepID=UPI002639FDAE|nr:hypothetical protein [Solidesulfovibrio sp.]